jgi:hypothetical protein
MFCQNCGETNDPDSTFCQSCGESLKNPRASVSAKLTKTDKKDPPLNGGFVSRVERGLYFKIARGFTWLLIFIATIAFFGSLFFLIPNISSLYFQRGSDISREEIAQLLDKNKKPSFNQSVQPKETIDVNQINNLNSEITRLLYALFTEEAQINLPEFEIEEGRRAIGQLLSYWPDINTRIKIIKDMKIKLKGIGKTKEQIGNLIEGYVELRTQKEEAAKSAQEKKYTDLLATGQFALGALIFISLATLNLALLAIERNTRKTAS